MKAELCKTCFHTSLCRHDKNLVGDIFVRGFFDLDDAWEKFKEWAKAGFPCDDYIPAADVVEVRHGRWEHYEHREPQYDIMGVKTWAEAYKCSNCGFIHSVIEDFGHYAFCPNCGASMVNEDE